ncbi:M23 family metallopeptidase [Arsenicicoccus sp. oral taxon 190]|uniref:M23 family metallopeptidase n=1 Tax=Arsenicicoccus sp. oral taxon 190 TaxID=1658671 RepID=UPI00067A0943|nr:M23 family metallopeptidase [Arsenicicoccus sp. oral taxon 190]AKT50115.1 hypothetical protein ADJ73_00010 [Arsenicicoccus sp. oral taxon 190]
MAQPPSAGAAPAPARGRHRAARRHPQLRRLGLAGAVAGLAAGAGAAGILQLGPDRSVAAGRTVPAALSAPRDGDVAAAVGAAPSARLGSAQRADRSGRAAAPARTTRTPARAIHLSRTTEVVTVPAALAVRPAAIATPARPATPPPPAWVKPVDTYQLTSRFGPRWGGSHHGLDFACPVGTPVRSIGAGVVTAVASGHAVYGTYVDIRHTDGSLARYGHLSRADVAVGATLTAGQVLGLSGNSGRSTGPHLHLEIHPKGDPNLSDAADPEVELRRRGVTP